MSQSGIGERTLGGLALAHSAIQQLIDYGVREFVIAAGSRNQPFVNVLKNDTQFKKWYGFEERSCAFFAFGRARQTNRPVAVITTSGTAAGELLTATMEAYYTSVPLVLLTADRPIDCRHANTPQTCNQERLFGIYAQFIDYDEPKAFEWDLRGPLHLNVCLEEPSRSFIDTPPFTEQQVYFRKPLDSDYVKLEQFYNRVNNPLVIVSTLYETASLKSFLLKLKAPLYIEALSHLREDPDLLQYTVTIPTLEGVDGVLRIGGLPTHRIWRDLDTKNIAVLSITENPFIGLRQGDFIHADIEPFFKSAPVRTYNKIGNPQSINLNKEEAAIRSISEWAPSESLIYLGNSLPIREWDKVATLEQKDFKIFANRGLNGIDGQISSFLGLVDPNKTNIGIFGDLTTLYDLQALWFLSTMEAENIQIIVINNSGGMIFEKIFGVEEMLNRHSLNFKGWADLFKLEYSNELKSPYGRKIIELII